MISPDGKRVKGKNLTKLIEKYDISTRISYLINGKVDYYKGWKRFDQNTFEIDPRRKGRSYYRLLSPEGKIIEGTNISDLIRNYNVSRRIEDFISDKIKSYKGWIKI